MKKRNILLTANTDLAAPFLALFKRSENNLIHLPLEIFDYYTNENQSRSAQSSMDDFAYVVYGNLRNARYFVRWAQENKLLDSVREKVNLVPDQACADFLESEDIIPVMPKNSAKAVDILEFILRISYQGEVLYPTTNQKDEEIPGLLQELDMPVFELPVCTEVPVDADTLNRYRKITDAEIIDIVLFHNRSSVIRMKTAFPDLDFNDVTCIAADTGVSQKMISENITPHVTANGSWQSLAEVLSGFD